MRHLSLQYRIALAMLVPLLIFSILGIATGAYALQKIPQDLAMARQTDLARVSAAGVGGNLRVHVRLLEVMAAERAAQADDPVGEKQTLDQRLEAMGGFSRGLVLMDANGNTIAATPAAADALGHNFGDRDYFSAVRSARSAVFSTVFESAPNGSASVAIVVPVLKNDRFMGVLLGGLALEQREWARDLNLLNTPDGGNAYLVDNSGTIIYHRDSGRIGQSIRLDRQLWRLTIAGDPKSIIYPSPSAGKTVVASFAPIPGIAWGIIVEEPWNVVTASIVPFEWAVGGLVTFGMLAALLTLALSFRQLTRPLRALVAEGQRVASGEPFRPLAIQGPPDLRTLFGAVNQMVARLDRQQEELRRYAGQVLQAQEQERLRLARDLHDETVQSLVSLARRLELCVDLNGGSDEAVKIQLRELQDMAYDIASSVRRLSNNLRPSTLEDLGLAAGLQVLARELGDKLPQCRIQSEIVGEEVRLPIELELTAYRIAQEALTNVYKHAPSATRVNLSLIYENRGFLLMVENDGPGFAVPDREALSRDGHLGLAGMVERAQLSGGALTIVSEPDEGTIITFRFTGLNEPLISLPR